MSSALYRLGRAAFRARGRVLALWVVVLAILFTGAGLLSVGTDNTYSIPGTESQDALDALARTFPQVSGTSAQLVAVAPDGISVRDPAFQAAVESAATSIAAIPQVSSATSPYASSTSANISSDASAALVPIQLSVGTTAVLPTTADALQDAGAALATQLPDGSQVAVGGQLFSQTSTGISITELIGIGVAFVVLLLTFASAVAAGIPLVTALLGVGAALAIVLAATRFVTITSTTPLLALMLGLAVGIDYGLFVVARHQEQLKAGLDPEESAARAVATSGSAVVFAATTVVIALVGLSVAGIPFLTTMGIAAALAVVLAVAMSLTLLPALLGFAGWHVVAKRYRPTVAAAPSDSTEEPGDADDADELDEYADEPGTGTMDVAATDVEPEAESEPELEPEPDADVLAPAAPPSSGGFFGRWVRAVTRYPVVTIVLIVATLGLAAWPATQLRLALPDAGSLPEDAPGRIAYDLIADHFGPGFNGPLIVTGSVIQSSDPVSLMDDLGAEIATMDRVASVALSTPNEDGDTGIVQVIPDGSPDSRETKLLVAELRAQHDHFLAEYGVDLSVTGYTAAGIDISTRLGEALAPFGLLVVGLSLVLLAMVFRSIVVPVTAALGYALSIAAAFGLTSLVFVDGVFADLFHVADVGVVISFMPIILMGVLFGLAMDYEVFLVSRMREHYVHHGDPKAAVHEGFVASARVVTAAATIMFAVFAAFVPEGDASIQPIAFGLAVGVVIDAFIVRMALIPAILVLFGRGAWWMPRALDRLLPHFDVEGAGLAAELALAQWPAEADIAIAGEEVRAAGSDAVLDAMLPTGDALVLTGGSTTDRTALLLALGGRRTVTAERLKVAGLVLPARAGAVRRRTAYVRLTGEASVDAASLADAATASPQILLLDDADAVADADARTALRVELTGAETIADEETSTLTLVIACHDEAAARALLPTAVRVHTVVVNGVTQPERVEVPA